MLLHLVRSLEFNPVEECQGEWGDIHHLVPRVTFPRMPFLSASCDPKHTRPWFSTTICSFWRGDACDLQVVKRAENVERRTCKGRE